ncbi:molybdate ABC transporter substrate-binding protein [Actinotalea solisilvae]|uniref:molybdate ABC transporter substrate-binding protein n=1 Tax=Actinotalea solisilvae TaxID=2072922 RepID=UPI0027DD34F3|nr:molybdate ABC transporter substrate-binding protein [Actinotalea solisilvae]
MTRSRVALGAAAAVLLLTAGIGLGRAAGGPEAPSPADGALRGEVVVLAAASLAGPYEQLAAELEAAHPGLRVTLSVGPSSALAAQVVAGAPADVLATASEETMATAVAGLRDADVPGARDARPVVVATNTLALAVTPDAAAAGLAGLADLDRAGVRLAVCRPEVPCGAGAAAVLGGGSVATAPVTYENDVAAVLTKVVLGEVDAGLVYTSDVRPDAPRVRDGSVVGVVLDEPGAAWTTRYPVLAVPDAPHPEAAAAFVALVTSERGAQVLRDHGFGPA